MADMLENEVVVRQATAGDMEELVRMIQELADFEKMPDGPRLTVKDLIRDGFDQEPPLFRCKVAERTAAGLAGYALYFPAYSTWEGRSLVLEDLYVRPTERMRGVGTKLIAAVARECHETGCSRLDLKVLSWNPARQFYERRGATDLTEREHWHCYRLGGEALKQIALFSTDT